jgi:flagellar secretion chaperone FliS
MTTPRSAYREVSAQGGSSLRLVVMLYEQLIEDLRLALEALERKDVEARTNKINHAILILGHLQSALHAAEGSAVTQNLTAFYNQVRNGLIAAQMQASRRLLRQQITDVLVMREAWLEVERRDLAAAAVALDLDPPDTTQLQPTSLLGKVEG